MVVVLSAVLILPLAPPPCIIPFVVILGLLRLNEIHQVGIEGPLFDLLSIWPLLADPAQPHNLHLAVDVEPVLVSSATAEAATFLIISITKTPIVDSVAIDTIGR